MINMKAVLAETERELIKFFKHVGAKPCRHLCVRILNSIRNLTGKK